MSEMMDRIDSYLAGRLADDDLERFEEQLLVDDSLQEEVRIQIAFREALADERSMLIADPEIGLLDRFWNMISTPAWSMSATGLAAFLVIGIFIGNSDSDVLGTAVHISYVEQTRSVDSSAKKLPAGKLIVLSIDSFGLEVTEVDVEVFDEDQVVVAIPGVVADEQQLLNVVFGPLSPGQYSLKLTSSGLEPKRFELLVE